MINEVFYSILIRSALMGLQLISGGLMIVFLIRLNDWVVAHLPEWKMFADKYTFFCILKASICAAVCSLCFFFIRFLGGY